MKVTQRKFGLWSVTQRLSELTSGHPGVAPGSRGRMGRRVIALVWAIALALALAAVSAGWERIVAEILRAPAPAPAAFAPTQSDLGQAGRRALAEARLLVEKGEQVRALATLASVPPHDPAYPLAQRLRAEVTRSASRRR